MALYTRAVPAVMTRIRTTFAATAAIFILAIVAGYLLVDHYPETVRLVASSDMIDGVQEGKLWTDDLLNIVPSSILSFEIIANNVMVTLFAFAFGAFFGIGTLYIIGLNGLMLGAVFAFTHAYGLSDELFEFVIAHGVVELSVICIAGAAGVQLGEALVNPGPRTRVQALQDAVADGGRLLMIGVPFLIGAGIIEGYVSPSDEIDLTWKIALGLGYGLLFALALSGRLWRLGRRRSDAIFAPQGDITAQDPRVQVGGRGEHHLGTAAP